MPAWHHTAVSWAEKWYRLSDVPTFQAGGNHSCKHLFANKETLFCEEEVSNQEAALILSTKVSP